MAHENTQRGQPVAPMKILFVTDVFPPFSGMGGSGWSTYHLARGLRERGHDTRVVVAAPALGLVETVYDGFPVWRSATATRILPAASLNVLPLASGRVLRSLRRQWRPDVIHAQHVLSALVVARTARDTPYVVTVRDHWPVCFYGTKLADVPCPACLHGTRSPCNPRRGSEDAGRVAHTAKAAAMRAMLAQRRQALRGAAAVVAVSGAIAAEIAPIVGTTPNGRVHVIPNGIVPVTPDAPLALNLPPRYFLYVGKLAAHKGADRLPAIIAALPADAPPILLCGDGPEEAALRAADPTGTRLRLLGIVPNGDVLALMAGAVALVSPNRWDEPLSRTHLEAMSVGCPIVATDTGGTADAVENGVTGFLVPRDDTAALTARLARLASDDALRTRMGDAARAACERKFGMAHVAAAMEALYTSMHASMARGGQR